MDFLKNIFGDKALTYAELEAALSVWIFFLSDVIANPIKLSKYTKIWTITSKVRIILEVMQKSIYFVENLERCL